MSKQKNLSTSQFNASEYDLKEQEVERLLSLDDLDPAGGHFAYYLGNKYEEAKSFDKKMELFMNEMEQEEIPWKKIEISELLECYRYTKRRKRETGKENEGPYVEMVEELISMYKDLHKARFEEGESKTAEVLHHLLFRESLREGNKRYTNGYIEEKEINSPEDVDYYVSSGLELLYCLSKSDILTFSKASEATRGEKSLITYLLKRGKKIGKYIAETLKDDEDAMLLFESHQLRTIEYVSPRIQNNKEFFLRVLKMYEEQGHKDYIGSLIEYGSEKLRDDKEYIIEILKSMENPLWIDFSFISERLRGDEEVGMWCVKRMGSVAYEELSGELQKKPNIVLETFRRNPDYIYIQHPQVFEENIKYIEEHTKGERFVILECGTIWSGPLSLEEEAECIRREGTIRSDLHSGCRVDFSNKEFWKPLFLEYAHDLASYIETFRRDDLYESWAFDDEDVMKAVAVLYPEGIRYVTRRLVESREFVESVLKENPNIYEFLPIEAQEEENSAKIAVLGNPEMLRYVPSSMPTYFKIAKKGINKEPKVIRLISKDIGDEKYAELVEVAIKKDPKTFEFGGSLRSNIPEVYRLVEKVPQIYQYSSEKAQRDPEIINRAFLGDYSLISQVPEEKKRCLLSITPEMSLEAFKYIEELLPNDEERHGFSYNLLFKKILEDHPEYLRSVSIGSLSGEYLYEIYKNKYQPELRNNMTPQMIGKLQRYLLTKEKEIFDEEVSR